MSDDPAVEHGWQVPTPQNWIVGQRTGDDGQVRQTVITYVASAEPDGKGNINVVARTPEGLFDDRPLPFAPPGVDLASSPEAFHYHWRLLDYVFGLPNPRTFPAISGFAAPDRELLARYVRTTEDLARSAVINAADVGLSVAIEDITDIEHIDVELQARDREMGFALLLRHCDASGEEASFARASAVLVEATKDAASDAFATLKQWGRAAGRLHARSLNQLLREKLVTEEGMTILNYAEEHSPAQLLSYYNYGDLVHWDTKREKLAAFAEDEFVDAERRLVFLTAAAAIAHVYIGFGTLVRAALAESS
jgi:hypothetical protein